MKPVLCFGEAIIDFLQKKATSERELTINTYRQYPGGAPANAAVAVAKLGGHALFSGQVGNDAFGGFLESSLRTYNVDTQFLSKHPSAKTALAFVMLDEHGERSFSFYRDQTADMVFTQEQVKPQWFDDQPIVHFCSNTLTGNAIAASTEFMVDQAIKRQANISFDVNLRHNLWSDKNADAALVNKFVSKAHVLKFSKDEYDYLAQQQGGDYLEYCFSGHCELLLITDGEQAIRYFTRTTKGRISAPTVDVVDTTAGGDGFMGGLLFALSHFNDPLELINDHEALDRVVEFAAYCGAIAVQSSGAFPALANMDEVTTLIQRQDLQLAQSLSFILES